MTIKPSLRANREMCLSEDIVVAFQHGETTAAEREGIHEHLDSCDHCRALLYQTNFADDAENADDAGDSSKRIARGVAQGFRLTTLGESKRLAERFDILRFVARGGMGEVYEAFDRVVGGRVALKTLLCTTSDSPQAMVRLSQEVNLARRVAHPNVCRIFDMHVHRERGQPTMRFLAMEFVEGETLRHHLNRRQFSLAESCALARQLLQGLGAVHAAGVLHLDFKSQNVMLRGGVEPAQAVVMDFSLSRGFKEELHLRTSERQLAGSVGYMSPEQLECRERLGPSADVYAFGVVFFEMLTGHLPFEGANPTQIMLKQLRQRPAAPSSLRPEVDARLDNFVLTCLQRNPHRRYPSMASALAELDRVDGLRATPPRRQPSLRRRLALAAGLGVTLGSLVTIARSEKRREPTTAVTGAPERRMVQRLEPLPAPHSDLPPPRRAELVPPSIAEPSIAQPSIVRPSIAQPSIPKPPLREPATSDRAASAAPPAVFPPGSLTVPARQASATRPSPRREPPPASVTPEPRRAEPPAASLPAPSTHTNTPAEPAKRTWTPERAPDFLL
jgi:serine/threonine protein kinase